MAAEAAFDAELARAVIDRRRSTPGAMLPILHDLQHRFGYIDNAAVALMADALNVSKAETLGVVSFYHDFRRAPVDGRVLKLCRAESCQAMGCEDLVAHLETPARPGADAADAGRGLNVETVYCLGHCALSPAALLDGEPIGRLDRRQDRRDRRRRRGKSVNERAGLRPRRFLGALRRRRRPSPRAFARGAQSGRRHRDRAHRLARPLLAGAAGRGRDRRRPRSATGRSRHADAGSLFECGFLAGGAHPKALGRVEEIPYLKRQQRLIFARCGVTDPLSLDDYRRHGGLKGLEARAEARAQGDGRGGSGFGLARARRRRLPDRHQMAHRRRRRGGSEIRRLQCRRGRQRHFRRPHADGGRSLPADRGHGDRRRRGRRDHGLCLYPLGISARLRDVLAARSSARAPRGLLGASVLGSGSCVRPRGAARRRRLYLRRGDLAAREPRGQARPGARQAAAAGDLGPVRQADRHQQRAELRLRRRGFWTRARRPTPTTASGGRSARSRSSSPATSARRSRRTRVRRDDPRARRGFRRRHALRPPDPRGAGRRPARRLFS